MNAPETEGRQWYCRGCGRPLARDHAEDLFCSPCQRSRAGYDPRHDGYLERDLLAQLESHHGAAFDAYLALGLDGSDAAHRNCLTAHVRRLRRHGHVITGRCGMLTYQGQRVAA